MMKTEELVLTQEWDKVFEKSEKVDHKKVTFHNRFGFTLAADMYIPKNVEGKLAAIAVSGPFGAVKEQSSGLYAQEMAERGYLTIAFDPSFTGESGPVGVRRMNSGDLNVEDFQASVDYLSNHELVDPERIGIIGICGWGGFALSTAAIDPRIKATVVSTMYDLSRVSSKGYFDSADNEEARYQTRKSISDVRTLDYKNGTYTMAGGVLDPLPEDVPQFLKDYYDYYKTERGYHKNSANSNDGWTVVTNSSLLNAPLLTYIDEIRNAVMIVHGEKAHSYYMGKDAFARLKGDNKEFVSIPDASHVDLYDRKDIIPFDKMEEFFKKNLD